jgi:hypothetical protein
MYAHMNKIKILKKDQWKRVEHQDINSGSYSQLIFDKSAQNI